MTNFEEFSFNISEDNCSLPKYLLGEQFYSNYCVKKQADNYNHVIYFIRCSIERDNYLNNYTFYLKYNKEKDYYILNDKAGNSVENVYDNESDYSIIEDVLMNNILINICGHVPKLYFGDVLNKVYSKIYKYLNNNLRKISLKFNNKIKYLENLLCKVVTLNDIKKYDNELYIIIQHKFIELFIKLDNKEFVINDIVYKIDSLKFDEVKLTSFNVNYNFKIPKKSLKINKIKYLY